MLVVYWYQLGEHVLFGRWDLGLKVRWALAGKPKWPALIKVMLQIPASEPEDRKSRDSELRRAGRQVGEPARSIATEKGCWERKTTLSTASPSRPRKE